VPKDLPDWAVPGGALFLGTVSAGPNSNATGDFTLDGGVIGLLLDQVAAANLTASSLTDLTNNRVLTQIATSDPTKFLVIQPQGQVITVRLSVTAGIGGLAATIALYESFLPLPAKPLALDTVAADIQPVGAVAVAGAGPLAAASQHVHVGALLDTVAGDIQPTGTVAAAGAGPGAAAAQHVHPGARIQANLGGGGPLPFSVTFTPSYASNRVLVLAAATGIKTNAAGLMQIPIQLDGVTQYTLSVYSNEFATDNHRAFPAGFFFLTNLSQVAHTIRLASISNGSTDANDPVSYTHLTLPTICSV